MKPKRRRQCVNPWRDRPPAGRVAELLATARRYPPDWEPDPADVERERKAHEGDET